MCSGASASMPTARPCGFGRFNAAAEWAVHGIALGRGDWTFAGSDAGGHGAAVVTTPIEACESNDADPPAWRAHVLAKLRDRPAKRRDEWPPWNLTPRQQAIAKAAFGTAAQTIRKIPAAAGRTDPTHSRSASRMMRVRALARAYGAVRRRR
jgi:hypothetical protein